MVSHTYHKKWGEQRVANRYIKPSHLKYTDLCIYIDAHLDDIKNPGEYPDIEARIFEYLYHIVYALSLKSNFFKNFADYDDFAMYSAGELFLSMRKKQINAGQEIRGRLIVPVKSCLNFIKKVLFPLKVNYERQTFALIYNPEVGHDTDQLAENMRASVQASYRNLLKNDLIETSEKIPQLLWHIVKNTPYQLDEVMLDRIYISCQLTFLNDIILSKKATTRVDKYISSNRDIKVSRFYQENNKEVILWHLPNHMKDFIRILVTRLKHDLSDELQELRSSTDLSEEVIDDILNSAYDTHTEIDEEW